MRELDVLFDEWETKHIEKGYKKFIRDGIVDEDWWAQEQNVPKICFFLKEARTEQEKGYNLAKDLYNRPPWKLWQKVAVWTQAIQFAFSGGLPYDDNRIKKNSYGAIRRIAVVNIKKSNGLAESTEDDLLQFIESDRKLLKKEIEIINPDIIVCGYTLGMLRKVLGNELEMNATEDTMYAFWKDKLIIDYYHPACHYPNRVNYYALMSICRLAADEWRERKTNYVANKNNCRAGTDF